MMCSWLSIPFLVIGILACGGCTRINQKVIPCMIGTINITNNVCSFVNHVVREAYDSAPIIPAPPVPEDHVAITCLRNNESLSVIGQNGKG